MRRGQELQKTLKELEGTGAAKGGSQPTPV
jgi:hypothetical protein